MISTRLDLNTTDGRGEPTGCLVRRNGSLVGIKRISTLISHEKVEIHMNPEMRLGQSAFRLELSAENLERIWAIYSVEKELTR